LLTKNQRKDKRKLRHLRIRAKVKGTVERPRLCVYRSNKHIYAQIIDDISGKTLCSSSTKDKKVLVQVVSLNKIDKAKVVGGSLAENAKEVGIKRVVFDRCGYRFHGRIKALAESARDKGLLF